MAIRENTNELKAAAEMLASREELIDKARQEKHEILELETLVAEKIREIDGLPLPPSKKAEYIAMLRSSAANNNAMGVIAAVVGAVDEARVYAQEYAVDTGVSLSLMLDEYELDEQQWRRVYNLSVPIDIHDPQSVQTFVEFLNGEDTPPELKKPLQESTTAMVQSPVVAEAIGKYNGTSPEAKVHVHAAIEQGKNHLKEAKKDKDPKLAKEAQRTEDLGGPVDKETQDALKDHKDGKANSEQTKEKLEQANNKKQGRIADNISQVIGFVSAKERELLKGADGKQMDSQEVIQTAREVFKKRRENPSYAMSGKESAAMHVFMLAREKEIIERLADNAVAKDLELGVGTMQQRTDRAMAILQKESGGSFSKIPEAQLKSMVTSILTNADEHKYKITSLDEQAPTTLQGYYGEVLDDSKWAKSFDTATQTMGAGIEAMASGDQSAADDAAKRAGLGTKRVAERLGASAAAAQTVGGAVTTTLGTAGTVATNAMNVARETGAVDVVSSAIDGVMGIFGKSNDDKIKEANLNADIAAQVKKLEAQGWGNVSKDGKKLFDLSGDTKADVEAIKAALKKSGVNIEKYDVDKNGLNAEELAKAMTDAAKQQHAELIPGQTPVMAAKAPDKGRS